MRFLLPPSETKRDGVLSSSLDTRSLALPELAAPRDRAVSALATFCAKPTPRVRAAIGTSAKQDTELVRNAQLLVAPTSPAHDIYEGVLFGGIDFASASPAVQRRITEHTLVQSALFGVVGFGDLIPAYRCSADSTLPRLGSLAAYWRPLLHRPLQTLLADELVIDLRSGPYASMWRIPDSIAHVTIKVMQERGGQRVAVSHANKLTKGRLVRAVCEQRAQPRGAEGFAEICERAGFDVRLTQPHVLEVLAVQ